MVLKSLFAAAAVLALTATSAAAQSAPVAPAAPVAAAPAPGGYTQIIPRGGILPTLRGAGQFTTLLKILDMSGLAPLLSRAEPIAIFAPTDAAFAALPPGQLTAIMQPGATKQLQQRFVYLIFNGGLEFSALDGKAGPVPGAGGDIYVDAGTKPAKVNDATLLQAVKATNGNIYVIDKVIAPGYTPPAAPAVPAETPAPAK